MVIVYTCTPNHILKNRFVQWASATGSVVNADSVPTIQTLRDDALEGNISKLFTFDNRYYMSHLSLIAQLLNSHVCCITCNMHQFLKTDQNLFILNCITLVLLVQLMTTLHIYYESTQLDGDLQVDKM